jgi:hypothetical protein
VPTREFGHQRTLSRIVAAIAKGVLSVPFMTSRAVPPDGEILSSLAPSSARLAQHGKDGRRRTHRIAPRDLKANSVWANGPASGMGRVSRLVGCAASLGAVPVSECACLPGVSNSNSGTAVIVIRRPCPISLRLADASLIRSGTIRLSLDQAAGCKRVKLGIGTILLSRGRPNLSQTWRKASASPSISSSLWNGVGVMRSRSVPFGTVG